ncbi:protein kinase [Herbiconiux moechotypicola]|uniref:non-specific serine/threonine protein kinase n=1 Tax=Herbiconiux moechotypicola TaxID=637393 RepID=A0ABN3D8G3_9MICO|nr:protein kinase [Herbiconiux moechotypicola]MCS5728263.1 protein kinase [Herbiconiux moechotypicola]
MAEPGERPEGGLAPGAGAGLVSGRFRLGELLGSGGSASVFAADDLDTGLPVALKVLHPHLSRSAAAREGFFAEARAAERLLHPNIVRVLGVGVHDEAGEYGDPQAWIALERAPGVTLAEFVEQRGPLPAAQALAVADGVLSALAYAHAEHLVHRDVSPANVMIALDRRGTLRPSGVRLLDFGLADAAGRAAVGTDVLRGQAADGDVGVLGNVNYLSPEQARGDAVDERGDVYQAGAVLYFALVGAPPFVRPTRRAVMLAHLSAPPPVPSVSRAGVSRALDRVVVRALLKDPAARFASAQEMLLAVRAAATHLAGVAAITPASGTEVKTAVLPRTRGGAAVPPLIATGTATVAPTGTGTRARTAPSVQRPMSQPEADPRQGRAGAALWLIVAAVVGVVVVAWSMAAGGAPSSLAGVAPSGSVAQTSSAAPTAPDPVGSSDAVGPTSGAVPDVVTAAVETSVPAVAGSTSLAARAALEAAGLAVGAVSAEFSALAADTVLRSEPGEGSPLTRGQAVALVVASGTNLVPPVVGSTQTEAQAAVRDAGFTSILSGRASEAPAGSVIASLPADGVELAHGATITLTVSLGPAPGTPVTPTSSAPTPTPTPTPTPR